MAPSVLFFLNLFSPALGISFTNIKEAKGSLYMGIFKSEADFLLEDKTCFKKTIPVTTTGTFDLDVSELAPGTYAVSCFHDLNGNGKMDMNFMGIPTEPYGFSNNVRPTLRPPKWGEAKFEMKEGGGRISIRLEKW
jgi:uncharacterized protein (DUF2141 family)